MTEHEVEMALGYTPCVCGVIDGTWHTKCYRGKTKEQIASGYKKAFANARKHLKQQEKAAMYKALKGPTP
jgi:hypothetical protein